MDHYCSHCYIIISNIGKVCFLSIFNYKILHLVEIHQQFSKLHLDFLRCKILCNTHLLQEWLKIHLKILVVSFEHMPNNYRELDIAEWVLGQCKTAEELQRVGQELILYQERDLFDLLRFMKYLVDTLRKNNIVWGVGRGSSVASYILYLIGVHRIDSLYYDLDIAEFLK